MVECCNKPKKQSIRRATTPKQIFTLDLENVSDLSEILITYAQRGVIVVERRKAMMTIEENKVWFRLTQEETLSFRENIPVEIQVRVFTPDGTALASDIFEVSVGRVLDEEVFENETEG